MDELKPCPFCGGKVDCMHTEHKDLTHRLHAFLCQNCGAGFYLPTSGKYQSAVATATEATELFNRRPAPQNKPLTLEYVDCKTCQFEDRDPDEEPCWHCKGAYPSRYARKPEQEDRL